VKKFLRKRGVKYACDFLNDGMFGNCLYSQTLSRRQSSYWR
jgi:hypothetical protein